MFVLRLLEIAIYATTQHNVFSNWGNSKPFKAKSTVFEVSFVIFLYHDESVYQLNSLQRKMF